MNDLQKVTFLISKITELLRSLGEGVDQSIELLDQQKYNDCKLRLIHMQKILNDTVFKLTLNLSKFEIDKK